MSSKNDDDLSPIQKIKLFFDQTDRVQEISRRLNIPESHVERLTRSILNVIIASPEDKPLKLCNPASILNCIYDSHALGLEIDARKLCYLVPQPIKNKAGDIIRYDAVLKPGYFGYVHKLRQGLQYFDIQTQLIWEKDIFKTSSKDGVASYEYVPEKEFRDDYGSIVGVFCYISYYAGPDKKSVVTKLTKGDIAKIKGCAKTQMIWNAWFDEKVKVAVIRRACKLHFASLTNDLTAIDNEEYDLEAPIKQHKISSQKTGLLTAISRAEDPLNDLNKEELQPVLNKQNDQNLYEQAN